MDGNSTLANAIKSYDVAPGSTIVSMQTGVAIREKRKGGKKRTIACSRE